jgi:hypothetical protein
VDGTGPPRFSSFSTSTFKYSASVIAYAMQNAGKEYLICSPDTEFKAKVFVRDW